MCNVTRLDEIRNEYIKKKFKSNKYSRENKIRSQFGHVKRRNNVEIVKKIGEIRIKRNQGRGKPKKKQMWEDIKEYKIDENMVEER